MVRLQTNVPMMAMKTNQNLHSNKWLDYKQMVQYLDEDYQKILHSNKWSDYKPGCLINHILGIEDLHSNKWLDYKLR